LATLANFDVALANFDLGQLTPANPFNIFDVGQLGHPPG
jgi:hypothetical protein